MSRTPEIIIDQKAVSNRKALIWVGVGAYFIAYGAFANDAAGVGLAFGLGGTAAFWVASQIKTKKHKQAEVSVYR